jgi:hypothetical protein
MATEKQYGQEDALYDRAKEVQADMNEQCWAWRIVNVNSGTCNLYWKEGENANDPCYR